MSGETKITKFIRSRGYDGLKNSIDNIGTAWSVADFALNIDTIYSNDYYVYVDYCEINSTKTFSGHYCYNNVVDVDIEAENLYCGEISNEDKEMGSFKYLPEGLTYTGWNDLSEVF